MKKNGRYLSEENINNSDKTLVIKELTVFNNVAVIWFGSRVLLHTILHKTGYNIKILGDNKRIVIWEMVEVPPLPLPYFC
jgi:hypothetical protein